MYSYMLAIFVLLSASYTRADVCNPIININSGDEDKDTDAVKVTTELQLEQARGLFKQVSVQLLDEYETRLKAILSTSAVPYRPTDCQDIFDRGSTQTGIYTIYPDCSRGFQVRCDMDTDKGGWTIIQRRISDSDFYKDWKTYESGFGDLSENFWLGNKHIHALTAQGRHELRVDMTHPNGSTAYAAYTTFSVGDADSEYKLLIGGYHGNAGDSLIGHNGYRFSTYDNDNDVWPSNCASRYHGAWWYTKCHASNLNGDYGNNAYATGLTWYAFSTYDKSLTKTEMKIRRYIQSPSTAAVGAGSG